MATWKQIPDFPNYYVSDQGEIKNADGHIMKPYVNHKGYFKVELQRDGIGYKRRVHRLVAETFIPNKKHLPEVNHINLDKQDNRVSNLEWVSGEQNRRHYQFLKRYARNVTELAHILSFLPEEMKGATE